MPAVSSIIAGVAAGVAAAGTSYAIVAGEQGKKTQEEAMRKQESVQAKAAAQARSQARKSQQAMAAANRIEPAVGGIMQAAQEGAQGGPSSTMLTGPMGVNPQDLQLGRSSLLGG